MAAGGRYVEGAVMTSVPPIASACRCCSAGPAAAELAPLLNDLGFAATVASEKLGVASATKMCRSVMIKGLEAMVIESFTAARAYGVEDAVLASLYETFPGIDWEKQGAYFFQRVIEHGRRRAEEMREVAQTVREAGLERRGRRRAPPSARPGWRTSPTAACSATRSSQRRIGPQRRLAHRGRTASLRPRRIQGLTWNSRKTPGWLDWFRRTVSADFPGAGRQRRRALPRLRPGAEFPYAPERKYTPCDASKDQLFALRDHLGFARNVVVQATCHGADNRAMVDALRHSNGQGARRRHGQARVTDDELQAMHAAGVRGVRFNFVKRLVDFTPKDELMEIAGAHRAAGLARGDLFRGAGPARAVGFLHRAADHRGGRPHGPPRRERSRSTAPSSGCSSGSCASTRTSGARSVARSGFRLRSALDGERNAYATWCPSPAASSKPSPTACCGAPTGRTRTSRTTCPTTACWSISFRISRPRRVAAQAAGRQPHAPVLAGGN
jgi:hypothetical protein